ncbi:transcription factor IIF subunit TFG2 [Spizellomyces punctatus DAOM BR117]|uniref:Transcription initiation factor IIF subunit beta n=1 Tax=Spizellomyces punctatus (strain DAOM BR117) TaxID=645134 RepID=A0A0L0HVX9_SPIPD|nr:transcription factor IIF subunit TFG2 [Spizellomyces punctatus DAOM BR117]KND05055.1 hypothetical protein SPPG_00731 [Spizellomyces punctatus DAOM BR117]|eukprot:XP_016613094.1 hypothetical protein SPPG_00731 [Spizellomyces punctatus DAOM BR117]
METFEDGLFGEVDSQDEHKMDVDNGESTKIKPMMMDEDEDAEELGLDNADTQVWLVKVPKFLAEKWASVEMEDQELGSIDVPAFNSSSRNFNNGTSNKASVHLPAQPWADDIPKNYTLTFTNLKPQSEYIFTEDTSTGRAKELVGKVIHEGTIAPVIDDDYRQLMQRRAQMVSDKKRNIKMIDVKGDRGHTWITPVNDVIKEKGFGLMARKKPQQDKKERVERTELVNMIFEAFQKYPHWTFKGLVERTQQPQAWLKEVLNDLALLHKRGPYVGTYELKPEFKGRGGSTGPENSELGSSAGDATKESRGEAEELDDSGDELFDEADEEIL